MHSATVSWTSRGWRGTRAVMFLSSSSWAPTWRGKMLLTWLQWKRIWKCISGPHFTTIYFNSVEHAPFYRNKSCTENQMWMNLNLKTVYCLSYIQLSIISVRLDYGWTEGTQSTSAGTKRSQKVWIWTQFWLFYITDQEYQIDSWWNICCPYPSGQQMFHQQSIIQLCQDKNLIFGWQLNH